MKIIRLVISILCVILSLGKVEQINEIRSYFGQLQSEYFLSVGDSSLLSSLIAHELKTWKGIYLLSDASSIHYDLAHDNHNQILYINLSENNSNLPTLTLDQVYRSYFSKTPKLLVLTSSKDHIRLLKSNNWTDPNCLTELIIIDSQQSEPFQIEHFLIEKGYVLLISKENILTYGLKNQLGLINYRKIEFQTINLLSRTPIFSRAKHLPALYQAIQSSQLASDTNSEHPSKIYIHQNRYRVLSLPDLIEESKSFDAEPRPIVVLNFHGRENFVYIGSSNYTVYQQIIANFLFKRVHLFLSNKNQQVYILLNDGSKWLQMIAENGNTFYQHDSEYNNVLVYKNMCYEYEQIVKVVIRNKIQSQGIEGTTYGDVEKPLKQNVLIKGRQQKKINQDFKIQSSVLIVAVITFILLLIRLVYRAYKKETFYLNISKENTSSSLYNVESGAEESLQ